MPHKGTRVETGVVQFGDDWPGVFIRGDNAFAYARALNALLEGRADVLMTARVNGLLRLLQASDTRHFEEDIAP